MRRPGKGDLPQPGLAGGVVSQLRQPSMPTVHPIGSLPRPKDSSSASNEVCAIIRRRLKQQIGAAATIHRRRSLV